MPIMDFGTQCLKMRYYRACVSLDLEDVARIATSCVKNGVTRIQLEGSALPVALDEKQAGENFAAEQPAEKGPGQQCTAYDLKSHDSYTHCHRPMRTILMHVLQCV